MSRNRLTVLNHKLMQLITVKILFISLPCVKRKNVPDFHALKKIEFFEANYNYAVWAVETPNQWTEKYNLFKISYYEEMKNSCETDGISEEIWKDWYREWQSIRFCIESKLQPVIAELVVYRNTVDTFFRE